VCSVMVYLALAKYRQQKFKRVYVTA